MSELNSAQKILRDTLDGFVVVDAGPGTGKTHTIVERYVNMIDSNIDPLDTLMITFTNNAAREMKDRISSNMMGIISDYESRSDISEDELKRKERLKSSIKNVKTSTFDALCLDIVLNSPEIVSEFFGIREMLSRSASLSENETLNKEYFLNFYARFIREKGERYRKKGCDPAALVGEGAQDVLSIIQQLMSRGVIPKELEWFGDGEKIISGDIGAVMGSIKKYAPQVSDELCKINDERDSYPLSDWGTWCPVKKGTPSPEIIESIAKEDRFMLFEFIRDVYYAYICESIRDNRLTFGLVELFAFAILFTDKESRELHSVSYMIVDEFQDTNELQMKICLLLLKGPNLCVVGDWKQGIYGFRYASIDNITSFWDRSMHFALELEENGVELPFRIPQPKSIEFTENYRSSQLILDMAFEALNAKGSKDDEITPDGKIVCLTSKNDDNFKDNTHVELLKSKSFSSELDDVVDRIIEYRRSGRYHIVTDDGPRDPEYGDIAVLCRTSRYCTAILNRCKERNVPAFFQGDLEIMMSKEGKLALAWLRYINNPKDPRGIAAILAERHYPMSEIRSMLPKTKADGETEHAEFEIPREISDYRLKLLKRKRRPNDLLTSIFAFYGLNNDVTQSIIDIISSAYTDSLITISDLIRLIEEDIENSTKYSVDPSLDMKAVTIQTMHKSKGLEYPIVIIAGIDLQSMPMFDPDRSDLVFSPDYGIRCKKQFISNTDSNGIVHQSVIRNWRYMALKAAYPTDYSEERRILFVAMSRAKQYMTLASYRPSGFFRHYENKCTEVRPEQLDENTFHKRELSTVPAIPSYIKRRQSLSAHDLMSTMASPIKDPNKIGKGKEYGSKIHEIAYLMARGFRHDTGYPEIPAIAKILDSVKDADITPEVNCVLPIGDVSVKGIIDLYAEFEDHIEIHDYKTDLDQAYNEHYRLQISVYALAASEKGKPIRCFIDYISQDLSVEVEPLVIDDIRRSAEDYYRRMHDMSN